MGKFSAASISHHPNSKESLNGREGHIFFSAQPRVRTILRSFFVGLYKRADRQRAVLHLSPDFSSVL